MGFNRFDIVLLDLNPTRGAEIKKIRPCLIISPDEILKFWKPILVAPFTSTFKDLDFRVPIEFQNRTSFVCIDQIRAIDPERITKSLGRLDKKYHLPILEVIFEMFRP